ncbi:BTAD domain-containing putative transcriptional regulator [Streptomyces albidoflavus]
MRFTVLGPVQARRDGEILASGSPQQRALMAALLLRDGHAATAGELIDALWGDEPPSQALAAIRTYASRLRKVLGPGVLVSESGGYALAVQSGTLDLHEATRLATEADVARSRGDLDRARALITSALDLWVGDPLAGTSGPYAENQRIRLEEWRLQLLESRADMNLEHGLHAEAVSELTALTATHPLRERLRELLMLALYRSGRQAEALAVYADTRRLLADELGVDPRPELSELQQRILQADEELAAPSPTASEPPPPAFNRPSQLPATVTDFTGRASLARELEGVLLRAGRDGMSVAAVSGMGGVGKTTLAVQVAHAVRAHFPDGQLYVDLQGAGPRAAEPETVLGAFLRALGQPDSAIPDTLDERAALYRSTLDGRRVLVLLDNARDAAQIRQLLLPTTAGCAALVTSRGRMTDLAGAHLLDLDVLPPEEATLLFTRIVGHERVAAERQAALDVVAACGFLPLAIRIAASRLAARRTWTVSTLAAKLADKLRRLDELRAGDLAVKATFELGYSQLEPTQARAFRLLGLAEGPDLALTAAAALLDLPLQETEDLLETLVDASLLESAAPGRYRYGDLLRLYARACAERDEHPAAEGAALSRLLDFYLATAARAYAIDRPGDRFVDHLRPTAHPGLTFDNRDAAQDWLYFEADCLLACARQSTDAASLGRAVDLLWTARDLSESGSNSTQYENAATALRDAAAVCGDTEAKRRALAALSNAHLSMGRLAEADMEASSAHLMAAEADDNLVMCWAAATRGVIATYQNRPADAEAHLLEAIELFRADRDGPGEAAALCHLSRVHLLLGRTASAIELAERGADIYETMGYTLQSANARYALGIALSQSGRHSEALAELSDALAIFREDRQRLWEGSTHFRIAEAHLASGRPAQAVQHTNEALALGAIGGDWTRGNVLTVLGRALDALGQTSRALVCWQEALAHFERLRAPEAEVVRGQLETARTRAWRGA